MVRHLILIAALAVAACANLERPANVDVLFNSEPLGATVKLDTGQTCVTPCKISLPLRKPVGAAISRDGCPRGPAILRITPLDERRVKVFDVIANKTSTYIDYWGTKLFGCTDKAA